MTGAKRRLDLKAAKGASRRTRRPAPSACRLAVTASMGVAERQPDDVGVEHLLGRAGGALYAAKQGGRDRVEAA